MHIESTIGLRKRLVKNLKRLIGNPVIEAKELAAFDLIMSRREFLKTAQFAAVGALVGSAFPPTAWGRYDRELTVRPEEVGLTPEEMAAAAQATGISFGTELFEDTVYAQPVVSPTQPNRHDLIEAARSRMRVQSRLETESPLEGHLEKFTAEGRSSKIIRVRLQDIRRAKPWASAAFSTSRTGCRA